MIPKEVTPFKYASGMIMLATMLRTAYGFQYRQLSGFVAKTLGEYNTQDYTIPWCRINQLDIKTHGGFVQVSDRKESLIMLLDSTGIKQANQGEWIRTKWQVRRGFVKVHVLADADTRKILAVMITDDKTGDSPMLKNLLGIVVRPGRVRVTMIRDYDSVFISPWPVISDYCNRYSARKAVCVILPI